MTNIAQIERFTLKCGAIDADLSAILATSGAGNIRSPLEEATDTLVKRHLSGANSKTEANADRMAEFYKLFYILENEIREFISAILEESVGINWWDELVPEEVKKYALTNRLRESKEGLPPRSKNLIDYTTFGHLGEIMKANWETFAGIFPSAQIERMEKVLSRLGLARGPIAHCGYLPEDEVVRLKLAIRDWFALME